MPMQETLLRNKFNSTHSFEKAHTVPNSGGKATSFEGSGLTMDQVESVIAVGIDKYIESGKTLPVLSGKNATPVTLQTIIKGKTIEYKAGVSTNGTIKVSDYYIK
jgi:hypothetical protein